jgi:hypothetical protein
MKLWKTAHTCSLILAMSLMLASCGGSTSSSTTASQSSPNAAPTPSPTPGTSPTPTPTPTSSGTVIDRVEKSPWLTCGNCGNSGATGATAAYFDTLGIAAPSEDGSSTEFTLAATVAYSNGYFYQRHAPVNLQINALQYEFDLYIPQGSEKLPQGIEFECQQLLGGWIYNFSWQALYTSSTWRIFDYGLKRWDDTGIAFPHFTPGTWHHIVAEYHNDTVTHTVFHDALTVDGVRTPVNITHNAFFNGDLNNQFTNAVQLDSNSVPAPYSVYINMMRITYQ